jgi:hypothetical protein
MVVPPWRRTSALGREQSRKARIHPILTVRFSTDEYM